MEVVLVPTLQPGDLVVTDNLSPPRRDPTLALIVATGAKVLFLPVYSPGLNPIEKMWSKVQGLLRAAEGLYGPYGKKHFKRVDKKFQPK